MSFFGSTQSQPKEKKSLGNISADQTNSSQQAQPITWFAGRRIIAGQFISPGYNEVIKDVKQTTGKGQTSTVAHVYFCDFGLVIALGGRMPVEGIYKIIVESEIVWTNPAGVLRGSDPFEDITVDKFGQARIYWGSETQPIDQLVFTTRGVVPVDPNFSPRDKSTWPRFDLPGVSDAVAGHYDQHPRYAGQCYIVFKKWKLGQDRGQIPNIQVEVQRSVAWLASSSINRAAVGLNANASGVNIVGCLYEWFTDPRCGRAYPDAKLNRPQWEATATALASLRVAPLITSEDDFKTVVAKALEYFDGWVRFKNGLLEIGYFSHGAINVGALPVISDNDLNGEPQLKPSTYKDAFTRLTITISHKDHYYQERPGGIFNDASMRFIIGQPRQMWLDRTWLTDPAIARQVATEEGKIRSLPTQSGELSIKREWLDGANRGQGDRCVLNSSLWNVNLVLRINKVKRTKDSSGEAVLTVENERSIWPQLYIPPFNDPPGDFFGAALAVPADDSHFRIIELPAALRANDNKIEVFAFARSPSVSNYAFNLWASIDGASFNQVSQGNAFAVYVSQEGFYSNSTPNPDTTVGIVLDLFGTRIEDMVSQTDQERDDNTLLLHLKSNANALITEWLSVGQVVALGGGSYKFFCRRGLFGTVPQQWESEALGFLIFRRDIRPTESVSFLPGRTMYFKAQPYTDNDILDIAAAPQFAYVMSNAPTHGIPSLSPGSQTFIGSINLSVAVEPGGILRYTLDGSDPDFYSQEWPKSAGVYITSPLNSSAIVSIKAFFIDGTFSPIVRAVYTEVPGGSSVSSSCGLVGFSFSGRQGQTSGTLTMRCATPSSTIHFKKNAGAFGIYSGPISVLLDDFIIAYASASGFTDSSQTYFNNQNVGGGGIGIGTRPQ